MQNCFSVKEMKQDIMLILIIYSLANFASLYAIKVLGYEVLANALSIFSLGIIFICLGLSIKEELVSKAYYLWKIIYMNISMLSMYLFCALAVFKPIKESIKVCLIVVYIAIELSFICYRIAYRNQQYINFVQRNEHSVYIKSDVIISAIIIEIIMFILKYFDYTGYSFINSIEIFIIAVSSPALCIIGSIICVHAYARYKYIIKASK
jgi:hypothetical protein